MTSVGYIDVPAGATRLRSLANSKYAKLHDVRPAPKILTSIPNPSPPPSPTSMKRRSSILSSTATSLASPTLSLFPQLMLSTSLPPISPNPTAAPSSASKIGSLLSSRDPLSLSIMSKNFKRFVAIIGPVFWFQDRVEEIILWKTGPARTLIWMATYSFICFFPRILLLVPHIMLIGIILATYPYSAEDPTSSAQSIPAPQGATEGSVPWQANIQGIQNLMGATADLHDLVAPHLYHLRLTPRHLSSTQQRTPASSPAGSPYTPHILALLALSLFPLLFIIHLPIFPIREACLFIGIMPLVMTHPYVRAVLPSLFHGFVGVMPFVLLRLGTFKERVFVKVGWASNNPGGYSMIGVEDHRRIPIPLSMVIRRVLDDDGLSDACWNSEMREVQLWENERFGGPISPDSPSLSVSPMGASSATSASSSNSNSASFSAEGWSKQNLRVGERSAWTRGRDGWSRVGVGGEVSNNLTFSLAPGWGFVESEDWRKDVQCAWSGCDGDPDGWVYTDDAWLGSRAAPYGGSVTRRRRWVRRVWYDPGRASGDW